MYKSILYTKSFIYIVFYYNEKLSSHRLALYEYLKHIIIVTITGPCNAGEQFVESTSSCQPCPTGTYQPAPFEYTCLQCPVGRKYTENTGSRRIEDCLSMFIDFLSVHWFTKLCTLNWKTFYQIFITAT